jgi:hypothetical protein
MGVVLEICIKHLGGRNLIYVTDIIQYLYGT